jgi:hypothetical protein
MSKRTNGKATDTPTPAPRSRKKVAPAAEPVAAAAPKTTRTRKKAAPAAEPANGNGHAVALDPSYEDIATRAYFIALERGFQSDPVSDWLLAEAQLRQHGTR